MNASYWTEFTLLSEADFYNSYINTTQSTNRIYSKNSDIIIEDLKEGEKVEVFTIQGKLVKTVIATQTSLKITAPSTGIYIVKLGTKAHKIVLK
jgi:hypothetical protein